MGKGFRFLDKYDTCDISYQRRWHMVVAACKSAMLVLPEEDSVRQLLKNPEQQEVIKKQADFLKKGKVGHSGPRFLGLGRDSEIPT